MPRQTIAWEMTPREAALAELIGSRAKAALVRYIAQVGPATTAAVAAAVGLNHVTAARYLGQLEAVDLITASHPAGARVGKTVIWEVNPEGVRRTADDWCNYLLGH